MPATDSHLLALSDAHRQLLESWLVDFDHAWDDKRLASWARKLPPASDPLRRVALIEMVKVDLERQWQRGQRVRLESYLKRYPELGTPDTIPPDLIQAEYEVRQQFGSTAELADFARRFPRQAEQLRQLLQAGPAAAKAVSKPDTLSQGSSIRSGVRPAAAPGELPERFGRYRIVRKLGQGAMGTVYLAQDTELDRSVALKIPHFTPEDGPEILERFQREARAAATITHPNICPVHDVGAIDGIRYLTMAYIEGKPLSEFVKSGKPLPQCNVAAAVRKLALALHEAHQRGVIHRDLKPSNIMINQRNEPVIMDFGLARRVDKGDARLTQTGSVLGTPAYMPPEQVNGDLQAMGPACDIYSLGVILYEMLTGRLPFEGPLMAVLAQILTQEPEPASKHRPDLDPPLEAICRKAMAKRAVDRYPSMADLATALRDYLRPAAPPAGAPKEPERTSADPAASPHQAEHQSLTAQLFADLPGRAKTPALSSHSKRVPTRNRIPRWSVPTALAGAIAAILLGIVLYVATDHGTIRIELTDPTAKVEIKVDNDTIDIAGLGQPVRLRAGKHGLLVTGEDFETVSKSFTTRRGSNEVLRVELTPTASLALKPPKQQDLAPPEKPSPPLEPVKPNQAVRIELGANLLRNPGCEEPLVNGKIPGWVELRGRWRQGFPENRPPPEGKAIFSAGSVAKGVLVQDVNVSGLAAEIDAGEIRFEFKGRVTSLPQKRPDTSQIIVEYAAAPDKVLERFDSGAIAAVNDWGSIKDSRIAPRGTREIRVKLIATRHTGQVNNGRFDDLLLRALKVRGD